MNIPDSDFKRLLEGYFDGRLSKDDRAQLMERLRNDPEARRQYWEEAQVHSTLSIWGSQYSGQQKAETQFMPEPPRVVSIITWPRAMLALAACVAVMFVLWRSRAPVPLAHLTYQGAAHWAAATPLIAKAMHSGTYELQSGQVRFETESGAVVSVAAPARFQFVDAEHIALQRGRLTARMLKEEATLTVHTGDLHVTDLGTAFGVEVARDGKTLVSVFDGKVSVKDKSLGSEPVTLMEGESALGGGIGAGGVTRTSFAPESFADLWPLTIGIDEASRQIEFLPPGPLLRSLRSYQANERLFLFPEQRGIRIEHPLALDLSADVRTWPLADASPYPLAPGTRVNSYLVFFQPSASDGEPRRLSGSITFQQRVLGVICSDLGLDRSDAALGDEKADYATPGQRRGLEEADKEHYRHARLPHDSIVLSPDGHTITFDFYVSDEREQMRVVVAAQ